MLNCGHSNIEDFIDFSVRKPAIRIRGGGRASTFIVNNEYYFEGQMLQADMIDVKGNGTSVR